MLAVQMLTDDTAKPVRARLWSEEHDRAVVEVWSTRTGPVLPPRRALWCRVVRNLLSLVGVEVFVDRSFIEIRQSEPFELPSGRYRIEFGGEDGGVFTCYSAQLWCRND
jgi:hypothetical protein